MAKITHNIHSIDGLDILYPGHKVVPYIVEEGSHDLTLIDTCYIEELPKLVSYVDNNGYKMQDIRRIILTHLHSDHAQAANEIKNSRFHQQAVKVEVVTVMMKQTSMLRWPNSKEK
jgi:glyoxylase-like metal-dependent hydrolase (beta-lactamase superfamily II)